MIGPMAGDMRTLQYQIPLETSSASLMAIREIRIIGRWSIWQKHHLICLVADESTQVKKLYIALTAILLVVNSTISSAITSNAVSYIAIEFDVEDEVQMYLPVSVYLIGYIFGPLVFSPLSETIGRKIVMFWTFNIFRCFTLTCELATNWPSLLIFRLIGGTCASVPLTVIGGLFADVFQDPQRGRAMVAFMSVRK